MYGHTGISTTRYLHTWYLHTGAEVSRMRLTGGDNWPMVPGSGQWSRHWLRHATLHSSHLSTEDITSTDLHTWHTRVMSYQDTEYGRWLVGRVEARGRGVPRMVSRLCDVTVSNELAAVFTRHLLLVTARCRQQTQHWPEYGAKISRSRGGGGPGRGRGW